MNFKKIDIDELNINPFTKIGKEWMLITAGTEHSYNTMTASWGGLGVLWNKNVVYTFVRPQRHTFDFMESNNYFSLSFYPENMREALNFCGTKSGRDVDKAQATGLKPIFSEKAPYFEQTELVLVCKKLHAQFLDPACFLDESIKNNYSNEDYHKVYVGEIEDILSKEK